MYHNARSANFAHERVLQSLSDEAGPKDGPMVNGVRYGVEPKFATIAGMAMSPCSNTLDLRKMVFAEKIKSSEKSVYPFFSALLFKLS